jgi:hypothetical protein
VGFAARECSRYDGLAFCSRMPLRVHAREHGPRQVSSTAIVVLGSLSVLCWLAVFAFAFRPTDFRRRAARAPRARRPSALIIYPPTGAMRTDYARPASELRWPAPRHSDLPERR